jgi:hypothetical protein
MLVLLNASALGYFLTSHHVGSGIALPGVLLPCLYAIS